MKNHLPYFRFNNLMAPRAAVLLLVLSFLMTPALAITRYVDAARPDNNGDGLSWATAHKYLQTALAAAQSGDQIWVAQGTYKPTTSTTDREATMALKEGVAIYGGFTSGQMNLTDRNIDPETNNTILSGDIDNDGTLENNSYFIFVNNGALSSSAILDGFTLTGINTPTSFTRGGTIWLQSPSADTPCSPYIAHCLFRDNYAGNNGAASFVDGNSSPQFVNCTFRNNSTGVFPLYGAGGAIYISGGYGTTTKPQFINCAFQSNRAGFQGSAIRIDQGGGGGEATPTLINCSFQGQQRAGALAPGNAIYKAGSGPLAIMTNCIFWDNGSNAFSQNSRNTNVNVNASYCLFDAAMGNYPGTSNLTTTVNPFVSSTSTMLRPCSPAIDAGNDAAYEGPATDLANNPRTVRTIDMGAYEFQGAAPVPIQGILISGNTNITTGYGSNCTTLTASGGTGTFTYTWMPGNLTGASVQLCPTETTTYTVTATNSSGCSASQTVTVDVQDVRCGYGGVKMCLGGRELCVAQYLIPTYLRFGATIGGCNRPIPTRIGYELESQEPKLGLSLKAYPNPTLGRVMVEVQIEVAGTAQFDVLDLAGRSVEQRALPLTEGTHEVAFDLASRPAGSYLIRCRDAVGRQAVVRVHKQ
ncbi:choice-of-anchor Q domain-containing protein [Salmonirosea aquatica]|uniref:T9SS type A sorting domain-containing protein n=1 Tax=Salmonirosea aquatica TaxID=2654236 RepID=A0A7C9FE56_9BACT|nr:T9SS type A sorting domain-containing protein [Cytophagaceae bacterium SJW1-29]